MSTKIGQIIWCDLTVENAESVRDFYQQVVGWTPEAVNMGDYDDYNMKTENGDVIAGVCHKAGVNKTIPSQWMVYIEVDDLPAKLTACEANGGKIIVPLRDMGNSRLAIIADPAGAVCALYERLDDITA